MAETAKYDVVVVGAGNAALCAALSAQESGARVLVLEKAPLEERGGNSLFTAGGFRFAHDGVEDLRKDVLTDLSEAEVDQIVMPKLSKEQYIDDLMRVTEDESDEQLAEMLIGRSRETIVWMRSYGVRFIPMFGRQSYKVEGKHHFYGGVNIEAVGGGFGLVEALIKRAEKLGIEIRYGTELRDQGPGRI
jgi:tricarballylate dehydrogenase